MRRPKFYPKKIYDFTLVSRYFFLVKMTRLIYVPFIANTHSPKVSYPRKKKIIHSTLVLFSEKTRFIFLFLLEKCKIIPKKIITPRSYCFKRRPHSLLLPSLEKGSSWINLALIQNTLSTQDFEVC